MRLKERMVVQIWCGVCVAGSWKTILFRGCQPHFAGFGRNNFLIPSISLFFLGRVTVHILESKCNVQSQLMQPRMSCLHRTYVHFTTQLTRAVCIARSFMFCTNFKMLFMHGSQEGNWTFHSMFVPFHVQDFSDSKLRELMKTPWKHHEYNIL